MSTSVRHRDAGFALVESIAVLALSALVLLGLLIASSLITRNSAAAARRVNSVETLATGLEALRRDLAGARFARGGAGEDAPLLFEGRPNAVGFVTGESEVTGARSDTMIWIGAQGGAAAGSLVRSSARLSPQMTSFAEGQFSNPVLVLAGPWSYRFSYAEFGPAGPEWRAAWSGQKKLPGAVRLEVLNRAGRPTLPPVVIALRIDAEAKCRGEGCEPATDQIGETAEDETNQTPDENPRR